MGILNVTPDSFSDGGAFFLKKDALEHAYRLVEDGADILDVGGESSRPGAIPLREDEERERIIEVIRELVPTINIPVSVDTTKHRIAEEAVRAGASIINDISGLRDEMADIAISYDVPAVVAHMHGTPQTFGTDMMKGDALAEIKRFFSERTEQVMSRGMREENIILDPGIGFGKTAGQDMEILENSGWFSDRYPVLIGPSRKRFLMQGYPGMDRDDATAAASRTAAESGARILRVHNVSRVISSLNGDTGE